MALLGGGVGRRTAILTDANLFAVHVLMCVNRRSRPRDRRPSVLGSPRPPFRPSAADMKPELLLTAGPPSLHDPSAAVGPHHTSALDLHKTGN